MLRIVLIRFIIICRLFNFHFCGLWLIFIGFELLFNTLSIIQVVYDLFTHWFSAIGRITSIHDITYCYAKDVLIYAVEYVDNNINISLTVYPTELIQSVQYLGDDLDIMLLTPKACLSYRITL